MFSSSLSSSSSLFHSGCGGSYAVSWSVSVTTDVCDDGCVCDDGVLSEECIHLRRQLGPSLDRIESLPGERGRERVKNEGY